MSRIPATVSPTLGARKRALLAAGIVLAVIVAAFTASPAMAQEIIVDPLSSTVLEVAPSDRTDPDVELVLTATVIDSAGDPISSENVRFWMDDTLVATVGLVGGHAEARVTPPQGAHQLSAEYPGRNDLIGSVDYRSHSVLPQTCVDQATPGRGAYVRHAYLVALGRCPDPEGHTYWTGRAMDGGAGLVGRALAGSPEATALLVDVAYRTLLSRQADASGRDFWSARLSRGWTTSQLWAALAASPEFGAGLAGADALVDRAFARIVGRPADPAGRTYWRDRLIAGGSVSATWRALVLSAEVVRGVVDDAYRRAVGRPATTAEAGDAVALVRGRGGNWRPLLASIVATAAAERHAQTYPDLPVSG